MKYVLLRQNSNRLMICLMFMLVLFGNDRSFSRSLVMMSIDGRIGTEVNSALTSYDMIMSSGPIFCS